MDEWRGWYDMGLRNCVIWECGLCWNVVSNRLGSDRFGETRPFLYTLLLILGFCGVWVFMIVYSLSSSTSLLLPGVCLLDFLMETKHEKETWE